MTAPAQVVSRADAQHVLFVCGHEGQGRPPGSFTTALITAIRLADTRHRARLARAYPGLVAAVQLATDSAHGIELLGAIAHPKETACPTS